MDNEIKEILDFKENADYKKLSCDEIAILKDYITNLQKENQRLKEQLKTLKEDITAVYNEMIALEIIDKHDDIEEI